MTTTLVLLVCPGQLEGVSIRSIALRFLPEQPSRLSRLADHSFVVYLAFVIVFVGQFVILVMCSAAVAWHAVGCA